jgi:hypothetical protein
MPSTAFVMQSPDAWSAIRSFFADVETAGARALNISQGSRAAPPEARSH